MSESNGGGITKPVTEAIKALSGTPTLLVIVVLNVLILAMIAYLARARAEFQQQERTEILELLKNCQSKTSADGTIDLGGGKL